MLPIEKPAVNGAELIERLAATGTGADKLELPRLFLVHTHRKEKRIATATEILDVMEKAGTHHSCMNYPPTPELTLAKARQIAETGQYLSVPREEEVPVEKLILAGTELPPDEEPDPVGDALEEFDPQAEEAFKEELPIGLTKVKPKPKRPVSKGKTGRGPGRPPGRPKGRPGFMTAPVAPLTPAPQGAPTAAAATLEPAVA